MPTKEIELSAGRIQYRDVGSGAPVVFIHGLLVDGTLWRNVTPALEREFRCIVPDWPLGSHRQPMQPGAELSPRGVARLIAEFIERLELDDVTLVANDTGGAIAQLLAVDHPERLARLVLTPCDAFDNFLPRLFRPLQQAARSSAALNAMVQPLRVRRLRRLPMAFGWVTKRPVPDAITDKWLEPFIRNAAIRRDTRRFLLAINARDTLDAAERLRSFQRPVLLAWATEDRVFPFAHARRLAEILPRATVAEVHDSYSFVPEDQPQELAALIADFATAQEQAPRAAAHR
jgi:pimeloyl-ACP methyl ester carboxylesterase